MTTIRSPRTLHYGPMPCQAGELYLPADPQPPVICLLHGGYWRAPWGREQMVPLAEDLQQRGFAVWNIGYRRVGEAGGGWPGTFLDVSAGIDALAALVADGVPLDLARLTVAGHSAGGHLALWSAMAGNTRRVRPAAVAAHAPVTDLARCFARADAAQTLAALMGGTPDEQGPRYRNASPVERLPRGLPQHILHGDLDDDVPLQWSRDYVARAQAAGEDVRLTVIPQCGHMDCLDPQSTAHAALCDWLEERNGTRRFA